MDYAIDRFRKATEMQLKVCLPAGRITMRKIALPRDETHASLRSAPATFEVINGPLPRVDEGHGRCADTTGVIRAFPSCTGFLFLGGLN